MFEYFRETFLAPRGKLWFSQGLIIESASARKADPAFARLRDALPYVTFDLLSKVERPGLGFRHTFRVKRPLGGLRLLFAARKHYDLVVFFAAGEPHLRLCRDVALLVMRPRRFFVFNEFGDGFWLHQCNRDLVRLHLERRYQWKRIVADWKALGRGLTWLARLPFRVVQLLGAALFFLPAVFLLAVLRLSYDTSSYRFRFLGKSASAPRRELVGTGALDAPGSRAPQAALACTPGSPAEQSVLPHGLTRRV